MSKPTERFSKWFERYGKQGIAPMFKDWYSIRKIAYRAYQRGRYDERREIAKKLQANDSWYLQTFIKQLSKLAGVGGTEK